MTINLIIGLFRLLTFNLYVIVHYYLHLLLLLIWLDLNLLHCYLFSICSICYFSYFHKYINKYILGLRYFMDINMQNKLCLLSLRSGAFMACWMRRNGFSVSHPMFESCRYCELGKITMQFCLNFLITTRRTVIDLSPPIGSLRMKRDNACKLCKRVKLIVSTQIYRNRFWP